MTSIPDFITHYHPAEDAPFQNLSDVQQEDLPTIIEHLHKRREAGSKRVFGKAYMDFRRDTEIQLRQLFIEAGGKPERSAPHYFVLGSSEWFAGLYPRTGSVRVSLSALSPQTTSFTYPDSVVAMRFGPKYGLPPDPIRPYHEQVFLIDQLDEMIGQYGLPDDGGSASDAYADYHKKEFEKYIEVQVWTDDPIRHLLR